MIGSKKISCDFLHLALILALVRLGPEMLWSSSWHEPLEVGDMFLGSTLAYRRFYAPNLNIRSGRYTRLKTLHTHTISDEILSIRDRSYFLNNNNNVAFRSNIIAYYSDAPNSQLSSEQCSNERRSSVNVSPEADNDNPPSAAQAEVAECRAPQPFENPTSPGALDLSPEDMDLIEILWKQDIDLGVSREAFNIHENHELEKLKPEPDTEKINTEHTGQDVPEVACKLQKQNTAPCNETENFNYIIDSETGEHVIQDPKLSEAKSSLPFEQSLLSFDGFDEFTNIFAEENCNNGTNFTKDILLEDDELPQLFEDIDPDFLAEQLDKLDNVMPTPDSELELPELNVGSEMYPSMEDYWQDISTTLPLSVMNQACVLPRPNRAYPEVSDDHSGASTSSEHQRSDHAFAEAILQNSTALTPRAHELNNSFTYLSPLIGPTSLGCAVASSIATLTNDTDPMPDVTTQMNGTFGLDLPGMLPVNQTTPQPTNETMLSELILDEDLQLMDVAAPCHSEAPHRSVSFMRIFEQDPNSNDTVSSLEYDENERMKFEELSSSSAGKEMIYSTFKYPSNQNHLGCVLHHSDAAHNNYGMGLHSPCRGNYSCFQHNHTYHLPFSSGNNVPKPVTRDRLKHLSCDNESNSRDEKRAKALELPITISEIINLAIDEFNEKLTKFELTEPQMTLIRDIRRRGKNKVAAQNCRKRKMDQISNLQQDLCILQEERLQLESERTRLLHQRRNIRDKYSKLCQLVAQSTSSSPTTSVPEFPPSDQSSSNSLAASTDTNLLELDDDMMYNQGVRSKRKVVKKS